MTPDSARLGGGKTWGGKSSFAKITQTVARKGGGEGDCFLKTGSKFNLLEH